MAPVEKAETEMEITGQQTAADGREILFLSTIFLGIFISGRSFNDSNDERPCKIINFTQKEDKFMYR
jgi:hypothetical protein